MAHYAIIEPINNMVINCFVGKDEYDTNGLDGASSWEEVYSKNHYPNYVKRYSRNTDGGIHRRGKEPFRVNFAGIGDYYDPIRDAFVKARVNTFESWKFNDETLRFEPPLPYPNDGKYYAWDEEHLCWTTSDRFPKL